MRKVVKYETSDGGLFDTRQDAERRETRIRFDQAVSEAVSFHATEGVAELAGYIERGGPRANAMAAYLYRLANLAASTDGAKS